MAMKPDPDSTSSFDRKVINAKLNLPVHGATVMPEAPAPVVPAPSLRRRKLGEILTHMGYLQPGQVEVAAGHARVHGMRLGQYLVRSAILSPDIVCRALALQSGLPVTQLNEPEIPDNLGVIFEPEVLKRFGIVPFDENKQMVCVAAFNPLPDEAIAELQRLCCRKVDVFLAREDQVLSLLDSVCRKFEKKPRQHVRYDVKVPVRYNFCNRIGNPADENYYSGIMINVSESGMLIEGPPVTLGSLDDLRRRGICLSLSVMPGPDDVRALCQIRSMRNMKHSSGIEICQLGLLIVEMSHDDRRRLKELAIRRVFNASRSRSHRPFI